MSATDDGAELIPLYNIRRVPSPVYHEASSSTAFTFAPNNQESRVDSYYSEQYASIEAELDSEPELDFPSPFMTFFEVSK